MENIKLRNLYINKITNTISKLHNQIKLLSNVDKNILNILYNQQGSSDINTNNNLNISYNNLNEILKFQEKYSDLQNNIPKLDEINAELKYLQGESEKINEFTNNLYNASSIMNNKK